MADNRVDAHACNRSLSIFFRAYGAAVPPPSHPVYYTIGIKPKQGTNFILRENCGIMGGRAKKRRKSMRKLIWMLAALLALAPAAFAQTAQEMTD